MKNIQFHIMQQRRFIFQVELLAQNIIITMLALYFKQLTDLGDQIEILMKIVTKK